MARFSFIALVALVLTGCMHAGSSQPFNNIEGPSATVSIRRPSSAMYMAMPATIALTGQPPRTLNNGEAVTLSVPAGQVLIAASNWSYPGTASLRFNAQAGKEYGVIVSPRGESFAASMLGGAIGAGIDAASNEQSGAFRLTMQQ